MTENAHHLNYLPTRVLWIHRVGKIAMVLVMKLVADVKADMGGGRFNANFPSRTQSVLISGKVCKP